MNISGIDKDFVNIINYLDQRGFKPFGSCDGVLANHQNPRSVNLAYISFLKSPQIIDLMTGFLRDKDTFELAISNSPESQPYNLYDNLISGNQYSVYFSNKSGDMTSYFERIIRGIAEGSISIPSDESQFLADLSNLLESDENSDLFISVALNSFYQPYMNKPGRINVLRISTKEGYDYYRNMDGLANMLSQKYGIALKSEDLREVFSENEFVISSNMNSSCEIYFTDEHAHQILEQIAYIRKLGPTLPTSEVKEVPDYDPDSDLDYDDIEDYSKEDYEHDF